MFLWKIVCPTIALLLHKISHVTHCVYILTKSIASFHPTSKDSLSRAHGRRKEACTCVTYIAKSNKGSMEMTNHTSWSRSCTYVESVWWKWNEILLLWISLSFIWISWGHGYIYMYIYMYIYIYFSPFFLWVMLLGHAIFSLSLFFW